MIVNLPNDIKLRHYQQDVWNKFFVDKMKHFLLIEHRRAGKDDLCVNLLCAAAISQVGYYIYLFPEHKQARKVIWRGITRSGKAFIDRIDKRLIKHKRNLEMEIELINGSVIQISGSNNYNSLVGTNPRGIIFSEYALQNPMAREYLLPVLGENGGWEVLQSTPRGMNHCYELYKSVYNKSYWHTKLLTVEDTFKHDGTPVIPQEYIEQRRLEGTPEEVIQSEYYCDFEAAVFGAYYSAELRTARKQNRIGHVPIQFGEPVYTCMDIGFNDNTSIWFFQIINNCFRFVHYYENNRQISDHYFEYIESWARNKGVYIPFYIVPWDMKKIDADTGKTRLDRAKKNFGAKFRVAPSMKVIEGIDLAKAYFPVCHFDQEECKVGLICLTEYHADYNEERRVFGDKPYHNWASHGADAFRYIFQWYNIEATNEFTEVYYPEQYADLPLSLTG